MVFQIVQMFVRGTTLSLMCYCLYSHSESMNLTGSRNFLMLGVSGSYTVLMLGLLLEVGLQKRGSDRLIECMYLVAGLVGCALCSALAYVEFSRAEHSAQTRYLTMLIMYFVAMIMFIFDIILIFSRF